MFSRFFNFLHCISSFVGGFYLCGCDGLDLDAGQIGLEVSVKGETICFSDFSGLGIFEEDFKFCTGEGLEMSFQFVR